MKKRILLLTCFALTCIGPAFAADDVHQNDVDIKNGRNSPGLQIIKETVMTQPFFELYATVGTNTYRRVFEIPATGILPEWCGGTGTTNGTLLVKQSLGLQSGAVTLDADGAGGVLFAAAYEVTPKVLLTPTVQLTAGATPLSVFQVATNGFKISGPPNTPVNWLALK